MGTGATETDLMEGFVDNPTNPAYTYDVTDLPGRVEHLLHYVYDQYGGDVMEPPQSATQRSSPEVSDSGDVDAELRYLSNDATSPTASLQSFELQLQHGQTPLGHPRDQILSRGSTPTDRISSTSPASPRATSSPERYENKKTPSPIGKAVLSMPSTKKESSKSDEKRFYHNVSTSLSVDVIVHIASKESSDVNDLTDVDPDSQLAGSHIEGRSPKGSTKKTLDIETEGLPLSSKPPISPRVSSIHKKQPEKKSRSDRRKKMTRTSSVSPKRDQGKNKQAEDFGDAPRERAGARSAASSPVDTDCPSPPYPPPPRPFLPSREGSTTVELVKNRRHARVRKLKPRHSMVGSISEVNSSDEPLDLPPFTPRHSPELTPRTASPDLELPTCNKERNLEPDDSSGEADYLEKDDNPTATEEASEKNDDI
ncbi:uncharacterized protein LOC144882331 [Branchiostoma floridae x Branchiostoma japonicum]